MGMIGFCMLKVSSGLSDNILWAELWGKNSYTNLCSSGIFQSITETIYHFE